MTIATSELFKAGWLKTSALELGGELGRTMMALANQLGKICPGRHGREIETLKPTNSAKSNVNSLSAKHGRGSFPLHTDGAHLSLPQRYVILACRRPGMIPVPTTLVRHQDLRLSLATAHIIESAVFLVRNGRRSFYSSIYSPEHQMMRFDEGCMSPVNSTARDAKNAFVDSISHAVPIIIDWRVGDILIIDNWRVLHGRGLSSMHASSDRTLIRIGLL